MRRSTAALLIAILFHLVLILLFWILGMVVSKYEPPHAPKKEHRIKVSLKEQPEAQKEALVKNKEQQPKVAPPMPKGKQLEKLVEEFKTYTPPQEQQKTEPHQQPINEPSPQEKPPVAIEVPKVKPLPSKEQHIPVTEEPATQQPVPEPPEEKAHSKLYSLLSKPSRQTKSATTDAREETKRTNRINQDFKELYGDEFGKLSEGEQKYLLDNQEIMRRITQEVLNRVGSVNIPKNFHVTDYNVVEFYLHPNGDISEIKFIRRSGFYLLDDTTKETIEYAYSKYPRPEQKTLIRYRVGYYLQGY